MKSSFCLNCSDKAHLCNKTCSKIQAHNHRRKIISDAIKVDDGPWKIRGSREKCVSPFYKANHFNKTNNLY